MNWEGVLRWWTRELVSYTNFAGSVSESVTVIRQSDYMWESEPKSNEHVPLCQVYVGAFMSVHFFHIYQIHVGEFRSNLKMYTG